MPREVKELAKGTQLVSGETRTQIHAVLLQREYRVNTNVILCF